MSSFTIGALGFKIYEDYISTPFFFISTIPKTQTQNIKTDASYNVREGVKMFCEPSWAPLCS